MYLKVEVNNNCPHQQWDWCNLSWPSNVLILIGTVVVLIVWDDNEYIIVAYRTASSMIMSLAVVTTFTEMFWCTMTFWKEHHTAFLTVSTTVRNQYVLTLNQNCIDVWQSMSSHLLWCNIGLYKQNIVIRQSKNDHCLRKVSVQSELLLINLKNRIDISVCKDKNSDISVVQDKRSTSCQLRDTYLYDTYMMIVVVIVAAALVIQESVLKYSIKKDFTYERWWWRSWRRKKKKFEKKGEEVYNSLHWQISWSELLKKTMCQQAIKILLMNLTHTKQANTCQQTMTTVQQPFQTLRTRPWRKRKRWCHELNSY